MNVVIVRSPTTVVGRRDQRKQLATAARRVLDGQAQTVLLGGDAGMGKTTLVDVFRAELEAVWGKHLAITGQCVPLGGDGLPYAPVVGLLRSLVDQCGTDSLLRWPGHGVDDVLSLVPELTRTAGDGGVGRLEFFEAFTEILETVAAEQPLLVVLEDLHWADDSTRDLMRFAIRALDEAGVLVIMTYRTDELHRRHPLRPYLSELRRLPAVTGFELPPLGPDEVRAMVRRLVPGAPVPALVREIQRRSEGIPFFVEELASTDCEDGAELPWSLRDALMVRISALSEDTQRMLRSLACSGQRAEHDLLAAIVARMSEVELDAALREAIEARVLVVDRTGYRFRHALLREALLDDLLPGEQARLHRRYAEVLEEYEHLVPAGSVEVELAHHWYASHDSARAFRWSIAAARTRRYAYKEALLMYERALELWDAVEAPEEVAGPLDEVMLEAMGSARDAGEPERALALLKSVIARSGQDAPAERLAEWLRHKAKLLQNLMRPGVVETLSEALALIPPEPPGRILAETLDALATAQMLFGDPASIDTAHRAIATAEALDLHRVESSARNSLGTFLVVTGREEEAGLAELRRAGELAGNEPRIRLRYAINYSDALYLAGQYHEAAEVALAGMDVAADIGLQRGMGAMLAGNAAEPLLALGEWATAEKLITRALELVPPAHHWVHLRVLAARLNAWRDEVDEAEQVLVEFTSFLRDVDRAPQYALLVAGMEAEVATIRGEPDRVWAATEPVITSSTTRHHAQALPALLAAATSLRTAPPKAAERDRRATMINEGLGWVHSGAVRDWAPVIGAELSDSRTDWQRVHEEFASAERAAPVTLTDHVGLQRVRHLISDGERSAARTLALELLGRSTDRGAHLATRRVRELCEGAGLRLVTEADQPAGTERGVDALTPREREVLELVARGLSNRAIGAALHISTKTASVHMSNILAKLGVRNRTEAAHLLRPTG
ncbi:MAG: helix-turn-helix transcriptional regulator [Propionibacteriaceae bacterium]